MSKFLALSTFPEKLCFLLKSLCEAIQVINFSRTEISYSFSSPPSPANQHGFLKLLNLLIVLAVIAVFLPIGSAQAIVGGQFLHTVDGETPYPFFASLFYSDQKYDQHAPHRKDSFCGGALIGDRYVITASHCVDGNSEKSKHPEFDYTQGNLKVRLGHANRNPDNPDAGPTGIVRTVEDIFIPTGWSGSGSRGNDFAILVLSEPVTEIEPIPIAKVMPDYGSRIYTLGHGISEFHTIEPYGPLDYLKTTDRTKYASYTYIDNDDCVEERREQRARRDGVPLEELDYDYDVSDIHETSYCGFPYELSDEEKNNNEVKIGWTCSGDSGGPHFYLDENGNPFLVGVSSYGPTGCEAPKYSAILSLLPGTSSDSPDSEVRNWIDAVAAGGNPFIIGAQSGSTHTITIRGANDSARDFRGHAGKIVGRTTEQKGGASDHLLLDWSGAITFELVNIDKIRVKGFYWEIPSHIELVLGDVEVEEGHFAINGILIGELNTESLSNTSEREDYGYFYADKSETYDVWNKQIGSISPLSDNRSWFLTAHQSRNNPTLAGDGVMVGWIEINGGGLHTPGFRECVLMASTLASDLVEERCFIEGDTNEYGVHLENLFGEFTIQRDDNNFPTGGDIYTVDEGGALIVDIHPDGRHDQVVISRGDAQTDGTLIALLHEGDYGDLSYYPFMVVDPDRDIEGSWAQFVPQSAETYYESRLGRRLPEGIDLSRVRLPDDEQDDAVDHIIESIFIKHSVSPYASLNGPFAAALEKERNSLLELITQPSGQDFYEIDRDQYQRFLAMQPLMNGFSIDTSRKIEQTSNNSTIVAARFVDRALSDVHSQAVHQRIGSIQLQFAREIGPLTAIPKSQRYATFGHTNLNERFEFSNAKNSEFEDLGTGGWIQLLYNSGGIKGDPQKRRIGYSGSGLTAGFDVWVSEDIIVGIMGGYASADFSHGISVNNAGISTGSKLNSRSIGIYGGYQYDNFRLNGEIHRVKSTVESKRTTDVLLSGPATAQSKFEGSHWYASIEAGYIFNLDSYLGNEDSRLSIEPILGVHMSSQSYSEFDETGAGMLNAHVIPGKSKNTAVSLGGELTYSILMGSHEVNTSFSARWRKETQRKGANEKLNYSFLSGEEINTEDVLHGVGDSIAVLGLRVDAKSKYEAKPTFSFGYNTKILDDVDDYSVTAQVHWKF